MAKQKFCPKCFVNLGLHPKGRCPKWAAQTPRRSASTANATQVGGDHYKKKAIQPWDYIAANDLNFFQGSIVKYVTRYRDKNGVTDLQKALHFLQKLIELESSKG